MLSYDPKNVRRVKCAGICGKTVAQVFVDNDPNSKGFWFPIAPVMCPVCNRRSLRDGLKGAPIPERQTAKAKRSKKKDTGAAT